MSKKSEPATKDDVKEIVTAFGTEILAFMAVKFDEMYQYMDKRFAVVDTRFEGVDARLDSMDLRLDSMDARLNRIENKLDATVDTVDDHAVRLRKLEAKHV